MASAHRNVVAVTKWGHTWRLTVGSSTLLGNQRILEPPRKERTEAVGGIGQGRRVGSQRISEPGRREGNPGLFEDEDLELQLARLEGEIVRNRRNNEDCAPSEESQTHYSVTCDACEKHPIEGYRYKCVVCDDYDLCGSCEADGRHPGHNMMRIVRNRRNIRRVTRVRKGSDSTEKSVKRSGFCKRILCCLWYLWFLWCFRRNCSL